jgi:hypothetical protein
VVRLFAGTPTKLAMFPASPGGDPLFAGTPFLQVVEAQDAVGNAQPVAVATAVALSRVSGGSLVGSTTCTIPAGQTYCIVVGAVVPVSGYMQLQAAVTQGDALAPVIGEPQYVWNAKVSVVILSDVPNPSMVGQPITVTASIDAAPAVVLPTGYIAVSIKGASGCLITLPATSCTFIPGASGTWTLVASYYGDLTFDRDDSPPVTHVVKSSANAPVLQGVFSRKSHGAAGIYNLPLN